MRRLATICTAGVILVALILLATPQIGRADTIYDDGGIHNINTSLPLGTASISNQTTVNILSGGNITGGSDTSANGVHIYYGTLNIYDGSITGGTGSWAVGINIAHGIANIYGGNITGGNGTYASAIQQSYYGIVNIYGGSFKGGTGTYAADIAAGLGTVNIHGTGFNYDFGPIAATSGILSGTLDDGTLINITFTRSTAGKIVLIPEPATALLFIVGAGILRLRHRKR